MTSAISVALLVPAILLGGCKKGDDVTLLSGATSASATNSSISLTSPSGVVADGATTTTITVIVRDTNNSPIPGQAVQLVATGSGNILTQPGALTDVNGTALATLASITAEQKTVSANVNPGQFQVAISQTATATFIASAGSVDPATSTFGANPGSGVIADGSQTSTMTITVLDANNNPIPGQTVQLAATGSNNVLVQPASATDASGVATGTIASTTAETKTVFVVVNPGSSQVILSTGPGIQFIADASSISSSTSTVTANPTSSVVADGTQVSTITVTVRDANNNAVPGQTVSLAATGSNNTLTQPVATTDASGVATGSITSTMAEVKTVTASVNSGAVVISQQATTTFIADAANLSAVLSSVTGAPMRVQADGTSATTITVTLKDVNGNPVPGQTVQLGSTGSNNTLLQSPSPTGADGTCIGTIASIVPELKTVTATVNPGSSAVVLSQTAAPQFVGDLIEPDDVRLYYGDGVLSQPQVRTWDRSLAFWSAVSSGASANATIKWTIGEFRPNGNFEYLLGVLSDRTTDAALDLLRWDGNAWTVDWTSTAMLAANADKRGFDLQHEASSGDALVVYSNNTSNPIYRTRSGGTWSAEANVFATPPHTAAALWVELVAREGTDEIALVYADVDSRLHAVIWNGSAWDEAGTETTLSATMSTVTESQAFDAAYEGLSGDLVVLWGHQFSVEAIQYATKPAGSTVWTTTTMTSALVKAKVVRLAAEPGTDRIAAAMTEGIGDNDTAGMIWDGSSWLALKEIDSTGANNDRDVAIGWVGGSGKVVLVYRDTDVGTEIDYATWTLFAGWSNVADFAITGMGDIEAIQMKSFGNQDELIVTFSDTASKLYAAIYDGTVWTATNSGLPLTSTISSLNSQPFCISIK